MLVKRVLTALVLVVLLGIVLVVLPPAYAVAALALLVLAGASEWAKFAGLVTYPGRLAYMGVCGAAMAAMWFATVAPGALERLLLLTLLWWALAFLWLVYRPERGNTWFAGIAGLFALAPMWVAAGRIYLSGEHGFAYLLFPILVAGAADVGAYFAGRRFGRRKLAPRVSPNKTWEGALGGLAFAALVGFAGWWWFRMPLAAFLPLTMAVALISIVGDLTESMFKRQAGLKDSGRMLPGHGGVLDRIDSLTSAIPLFALGLTWLGELR